MINSHQLGLVVINRSLKALIELPLATWKWIFLLALAIATNVPSQVRQVQAQKLTVNGELSLRLSSQQQQQQQQLDALSPMNRILNDEYVSDFSLTEQTIGLLESTLREFNRIKEETRKQGLLITNSNPLINHMATELQSIQASFGQQFQPLIGYIIQNRPVDLGLMDLAFRCERFRELEQLKGLAATSAIYSLIFDVFSTELYTHCFKRKLAMIKLHQAKPSSILQQFVDIYLDLPVGKQAKMQVCKQMIDQFNHSGLNSGFKLSAVDLLNRHGKLESVANLVLDEESSLLAGLSAQGNPSVEHLVNKFKFDCQRHTNQIGLIWNNLDQLVSFLSSPSNNLVKFNEAIKLIAPQLMYASTCGHLAQLNHLAQ